jgi:two-component system response regulator HydG
MTALGGASIRQYPSMARPDETHSEAAQEALHTTTHIESPRYFHLIWDDELEDLQRLFRALWDRQSQVLARWHELYILHFGDSRSLSQTEFNEVFGTELESTLKALLARDMSTFAAEVRKAGERLAELQVPFSELIVSMHLFEESAGDAFPGFPPLSPRTYQSFDKLSHCRIIVLADTYFRSRSTLAAVRIRELEREAARLPPDGRTRFHGLVGASAEMRQLYERIEAAAATRGNILIVGESGTGKELVARAIHEAGPRPNVPFIALNCSALPKDLIESELFGYKRGAFSGAATEYLGLFRAAEGGTLFLDEITEMSPDTQSKLLRAIQERKIRPVGSTREVEVDVRLIASTNRDPHEAVQAGRLREDLYYRLQASVLRVPSLRARTEDIPLLAEHFVALFNDRQLRKQLVAGIDDEALEAMRAYGWPGNVRELSNAIEGAFTFGRSATIRLEDLPSAIQKRPSAAPATLTNGVASFAEVERDLIRRALEASGGNKVRAARTLRISRKKLYAKIAKYSL